MRNILKSSVVCMLQNVWKGWNIFLLSYFQKPRSYCYLPSGTFSILAFNQYGHPTVHFQIAPIVLPLPRSQYSSFPNASVDILLKLSIFAFLSKISYSILRLKKQGQTCHQPLLLFGSCLRPWSRGNGTVPGAFHELFH